MLQTSYTELQEVIFLWKLKVLLCSHERLGDSSFFKIQLIIPLNSTLVQDGVPKKDPQPAEQGTSFWVWMSQWAGKNRMILSCSSLSCRCPSLLLLQLPGEMQNQAGFWGERLHSLQSAREMENRPQNHWILSEYSEPLKWYLLIVMI